MSLILNISTYKFVSLTNNFILELKRLIQNKIRHSNIKGSILLSTEGMNLFLSGQQEMMESFKSFLNTFSCFQDLMFRESFSNFQPFKKMLVKIKKEIISFGIDKINPVYCTAPYIAPEMLKTWYKERPDFVLLDVRNDFEVQLGSFENALHLGLKNFRSFPQFAEKLPAMFKKLPIVTFCTGGIRCEKASAFLLERDFTEVYQLQGGILNYFEKCGGLYYKGSCFVFDAREALSPPKEDLSQSAG